MPENRTRKFQLRLTDAEFQDLSELADYWGRSRSEALRLLIMIGRSSAYPNLQLAVQLKGVEVRLPDDHPALQD
ncbi:MAG: hypothetical protein OXI18_11530 [bacterium]|nr:hypothetical protein [bacterium]